MPEAYLYQICYSPQTRADIDPGFEPLDNMANERPDWREYWPIRNFLLGMRLQPDSYYGFFSPKFRLKTTLDASAVRSFIRERGEEADVLSFSPYFDQMALPRNIIDQAIGLYGEFSDTLLRCASLVVPEFRIDQCVMTSLNTIYCNFFVARPPFWAEWLRKCELIFELAEDSSTPLARDLNRVVSHGTGTAPTKVFVIERLASLLLWSQPQWRVKAFDPLSLPMSCKASLPELIVLDSLKLAFTQTGIPQYLAMFTQLRERSAQRLSTATPGVQRAVPAPVSPSAAPDAPRSSPGRPEGNGVSRIRVVCATRADREGFHSQTPLGRSLSLYRPASVDVRLFPKNTQGLPSIYNTAIAEAEHERVLLLFVHDDVHLCDFHWADRLREGLEAFDVVGLAGNRRRVARQPGWGLIDEALNEDRRENLSGIVGHGRGFPADIVSAWGPSSQSVKLLDGVFLAASSETLRDKSLRFDERFAFHFYDLDFCRQAERAGLRMGTWPISVVHESTGDFASEGWRRGYETYLEKWRD
jgi:hypothetical protein